jgi:hypothetical protein
MYYPKSQIKENLYTNGGEYVIKSTNQEYKGFYYKTSNGGVFTGKSPNSTSPQELILFPINLNLSQQDNFNINLGIQYPTLITLIQSSTTIDYPIDQTPPLRTIPKYTNLFPTTNDQSIGVFTRYFCKKTNELKYIEINKETHDKLKTRDTQIAWDLYEPYSITWQIKGDQESTLKANKSIVLLTEQRQKWYGFSQYLKEDYLKYYLGE